MQKKQGSAFWADNTLLEMQEMGTAERKQMHVSSLHQWEFAFLIFFFICAD